MKKPRAKEGNSQWVRVLGSCLLALASWLLAAPQAKASISASATAAVCSTFNAASGTVTRTEAANNTIVIVIAIKNTGSTGSSITDTGGTSYPFSQSFGKNGTNERVEIWTSTAGGSTSSTSVTINLASTSKFVGCVFEYSGVQALGNENTAQATAANPSISVTTQDSNNFCVGGFSGQGTGTFTSGTGTLRASAATSGGNASTNVGGALVDNTVGSPGTCTTSVTNADTDWALAVIELRSVAPSVCKNLIALLGAGCK